MSLTNAPAVITALNTQLTACAAWTAVSGTVWYPLAPGNTSLPFAVLQPVSQSVRRIAEGCAGIPTGTAEITIHMSSASYTIGQTETLGETLCTQLMDLQTGLYISNAAWEPAGDIDQADEAGRTGTGGQRVIIITVEYGLEG